MSAASTLASNALMLMQVLRCLPTSRQASLVCAAGTLGYHSFVEMMKCCDGPSTFILMASMDLLDLGRNEEKDAGDDATAGGEGDDESVGSHHMLRIVQIEFDDVHDVSTVAQGIRNIVLLSNVEMMNIDLSDLEKLETFCMDTPYLDELDDSFLSGCSNLHTVTILSPMPRLGAISENFLLRCESLRAFDMTPFASISHIRHSFIVGCTSLESIDLSQFSALEDLPELFMGGCTALRTVDISAVKYICFPNGFLEDCTSLEELILHPQGRVMHFPGDFLAECTNLKSINLVAFSEHTCVSWGFLAGCISLESLDLSPLSNVQEVEDDFLSGCSGLTTLDLSPLCQVTKLLEGFLSGCTGLSALDLSSFSRLKRIDPSILEEFEGRIVLPPHMSDAMGNSSD